MKVHRYGDRALLVDLGSEAGPLAAAALAGACRAQVPGLLDATPAARTVLLTFDGPVDPSKVRLADLRAGETRSEGSRLVRIRVSYDGPDLAEVARLTGFAADEVVRRHTAGTWQVAFGGFAPGFAYLVGGDPALAVPRRAEPRTTVPAGSVALAGEYSAVYPRPSPGGWQLIGTTDAPLWNLDREPPALLQPGDRVRFEVAA
ncbi:KipI family sensor histidine kinase inhibitor [Actinoplanes octamycinicus]|uniref:KipI family sensor histidine kinase inhibitor n=1 Tax=Actinoplanes octamycinicus TaxID=135948 RepID=A0A7W7MAQ8_9ACTN|nr:allophanate hydrolase subunit 1 [Actinoplanes octamycinicus]MBB4743176.1 KipI family sensor histidine kinase inhibitor [Actinoplanes octamycinicus]GIE61262.1 hypothetical protein Aoc01nite_66640 [Actinoplanes octamycinicus]